MRVIGQSSFRSRLIGSQSPYQKKEPTRSKTFEVTQPISSSSGQKGKQDLFILVVP
jgi:hypothetical protein